MRFLFAMLLLALSAHGLAAPLTLNINLLMDGEPLDWDATYSNAAGQDFTINLLKFYVSNVALVNNDGSETELDGLELTNFEPGDPTTDATFMTLDAPEGVYSGVRFDIGVPREFNHLDATRQEAPLGVDSGMYWAWNPGYIFYRVEGRTEVDGQDQPWLLHMGTDAFRLPVRIQDLLTGTVTVDIPAEGAELSFDLDLMQAFSQGLNGSDYDFANEAYRAVHGGPISAQAYTNLLNAITLSGAAAVEDVQGQAETAELDMQGEDIQDEVETHDAQNMDHGAEDADMQDTDMQDDAETNHSVQDDAAAEADTNALENELISGDISGTVRLPESVESWDSVIVLACARADAMCETPAGTLSLSPETPEAREASFTFEGLAAGEYAVYALNDKDGNATHTMDGAVGEEIGMWAVPGTFDPLYITPPTTGLDIVITGSE